MSAGYGTLHVARKAGRCANAYAAAKGRALGCLLEIRAGDRYVEGDCDPDIAGGFGKGRICFACYEREQPHYEAEVCRANVGGAP